MADISPSSSAASAQKEERGTFKQEEIESGNPEPWDFLTTPPGKESPLKSLEASTELDIKTEVNNPSVEDKSLDSDSKKFIEALDHLSAPKNEQMTFFYDQMLFTDNALLNVASEETLNPDGMQYSLFNLFTAKPFSDFVFNSISWKSISIFALILLKC